MNITTHKTPEEFAGLSAAELILRHIMLEAMDAGTIERQDIDASDIEGQFDALNEDEELQDDLNAFRSSGERTGLVVRSYSRHYEVEHVARQLIGGAWVGWLYWHGGGKHGEPEAISWLNEAELLEVDEEPIQSVRRTFRKAEA